MTDTTTMHGTSTGSPDAILGRLIEQNRKWRTTVPEGFFPPQDSNQTPKILWLGCSDSRVPESVILGCLPGEIFTHRNIANQVPLNDDNVQSVLTFAVAEVGVEHIIVTGHTRCGGVAVCAVQDTAEKARAFSSVDERDLQPSEPRETRRWPPASPIKEWLADLRKLAEATNWDVEKLSQENVRMQIDNVVNSEVVKGYWGSTGDDCKCKGRLRGVHGWMYDIDSGEVRDLKMSQYAPWIVPKLD